MGTLHAPRAIALISLWIWCVTSEELTPPYFNLATGRRITASSTCGEDVAGPELYCKLVGGTNNLEISNYLIQGQVCDYCDPNDPIRRHPPENAIDGTELWWQSPPMSRGLKYSEVNLTIDLGQEFHVAYVFIKMGNSPRPGVWVLERSTDDGKTYKPWQYFADTPSDCADLFGLETLQPITRDNSVVCDTQFSKVVPLEDGEIVVSLLNNRPSSNNFFNSSVLQEWTKATNIRMRLLRAKTLLGHLMNIARNDPTLTRRFFYSIRDISIGGRCVCNGHADSCDITDPEDAYKLLCRCVHNTCGAQCQTCCPGFVQKAWRQSKSSDPFVCEACNCHGHSEECLYDPEVDREGLSLDVNSMYAGGGVCQNCRHNTEGINCHQCKPRFYRPFDKALNETDVCQSCQCDVFYSTGNCAEGTGQCECRPQYQSPNCDSCSFGYYGYPDCKVCDCHINGTRGAICEVGGGQCPCKPNYGGKNCDRCAEGFYNFPACIPCECERPGSQSDVCDLETGQCECGHNFGTRNCNQCENGYFSYPNCEYCKCDPRGTVKEICDKEIGKCICKEGYDGPRCDRCLAGYYGYPDCRPCNCSVVGSASAVCTPNGKCPCLPNFSGRSCDQCSPGFYKFPECLACSCDQSGSLGVTCDDEGKCQCKSNFDSVRCDLCLEGFYNFPICEECNCNPAGVVAAFAGCGSVPKGELCQCKDRVEGRICDTCKPLYWNLLPSNSDGCEDCDCFTAGTMGGTRVCDSGSGQCACKPSVVGRRCSECSDGSFNLQEESVFGCMACGCNVGGAISPFCDKFSGQCVCRAQVTGRTCSEPLQTYYYPTLYQFQYEAEDGHTPSNSPVRFGYDSSQFPGYSWKGYAVFSQIQNEILHDINVDKPSLYRFILRYVNRNDEAISAKITITPDNPNDAQQSYIARLEPSREPRLVTVSGPTGNIPSPFVLNPGTWTVSISSEKNLLLDYFVLLPAAYYEATVLQEHIHNPCRIGEASTGSCVHYSYPNITYYDAVRGEGGYRAEGTERKALNLFEDHQTLHELGTSRGAFLNEDQSELHLDMRVARPGMYVLVLVYFTPPESQKSNVFLEMSTQSDRSTGQALLYECSYGFLCRQAVTDEEGRVAAFNLDTNFISIVLKGEDPSAIMDSVVAVPLENWSLDHIKPRPVCVRKNGRCVPGTFPLAPDSTKVEFKTGNEDQVTTDLPSDMYDGSSSLVYLDHKGAMVDVAGKVSQPGYYVFIVHFYQPNYPEFNLDVLLQNGQFYEAKLPVFPCPASSGCRAVIKQANGNQNFQLTENFVLSLKEPNNKAVWLDYVYVVPADEYTPALLEESPVDLTREFIAECSKNLFFPGTDNVSDFCRDSIFTITTEYNNGALACQCDFQGSLSFECEKFGGQCPCKENVIGRQCTRCRTGHFGFPNCKPCDCPSTALCDPLTGSCICPPRVTGPRCDQCVANTYGYDPIIGCEECNCNRLGVYQENLQCDSLTGLCPCKPNVVGRMCERCTAGYWAFPYCQLCDCDVRGTTEDICDQETAQCFCKGNVNGHACDICKQGTFNLQEVNPKGCSKCFCFGKASHCSSSYLFRSDVSDMQDWSSAAFVIGSTASRRNVEVQMDSFEQTVRAVLADVIPEDGVFYFSAPSSYLGNRLHSYGGQLSYIVLYVEGLVSYAVSAPDLILIGGDITLFHFALEQPAALVPLSLSVEITERSFVLPSGLPASRENIMVLLKDLKGIYIRGSYADPTREARLSNVTLDIAEKDPETEDAELVSAVEQCQCPPNYVGLSCEECAPGYYRVPTGPFGGFCVPCQCHGHADTCDVHTGKCHNCKHNTLGDYCEKCESGYHGIATQGTPNDCLICACPLPTPSNNFADSCEMTPEGQPLSCVCQQGYTGLYCESCAPGYYGEPEIAGDYCKPCNCSGNIDPTDPTSCDTVTGICLKCLSDTGGPACSLCAPGFFGDAVGLKDCQHCDCDQCGVSECNSFTGDCICKVNVVGDKCDRCEPDHYGFATCQGCRACNCGVASESSQCDDATGQCRCKPGVTGRNCDRCTSGYWNYSPEGCVSCNCNTDYSVGVGCNPQTGQCECLPGVIGDKCQSCPYRWVLVEDQGCENCDSCIHNLLDVTDHMRNTIDPVRLEFETVALSFFTRQKLATLNQSVEDMRGSVDLLNPSNAEQTSLAQSVEDLETRGRNLKSRLTDTQQTAKENTQTGNQVRLEALDMEKLIADTVQKSRAVIDEVSKLAAGLEAGAGPQIDQALNEAQNVLQEIRTRNFEQRKGLAGEELSEAIALLDRMRDVTVPVRDNAKTVSELKDKILDLTLRLADLRENSRAAQDKANQALALTSKNRNSPSLAAVADIKARNATVLATAKQTRDLLDEAKTLLEEAQRVFDELNLEVERLRSVKETLEGNIRRKEEDLSAVRLPVHEAQEHANLLINQAGDLDKLLADTRQTAENALAAANSYKNIVAAIDEALQAAIEATAAADNATTMSDGVGERAGASRKRSTALLIAAQEALNTAQFNLAPRLQAARNTVHHIEKMNQETVEGLNYINDVLQKLPQSKLRDSARQAVEDSNAAQSQAAGSLQIIDGIYKQLPPKQDKARQLSRDIDATNKATQFAQKEVDRVMAVTPDMRNLMGKLSEKQTLLRDLGVDVGEKIAELKRKVALARDQANRIKVGMTFYPNTTLQLVNPDGLSRAATALDFSFYFRTKEQNGFLFYLGNEIGTSKKMRRTLTDDFMALEIHNGYLTLTADLGSGPHSVVNKRYVADDIWYQAALQRNGKSVKLKVISEDDSGAAMTFENEAVLPGTASILNLDQQLSKMYVGGYPSSARIQQAVKFPSFEGTIEDLVVAEVPIGLWNFVDAENVYGAEERDKLKNLQQSTGLRFDGEGYTIVDRRSHKFRDRLDIQIGFRTVAEDGLLFLVGKDKEFMSVELRGGRVLYQYDLGGGVVAMSSPTAYNDGEWHTIVAARDRRHGVLLVDQAQLASAKSPTADEELTVGDVMFIGGYPGDHGYGTVTSIGFDGCIDSVAITGTPVDLSQNIEALGAVAGCPAKAANSIGFVENAAGYAALPGLSIESFAQVNFKFRTKENNGLIFYMSSEDQNHRISLALIEGGLVMRTGPSNTELSTSQTKYNDGVWHVVTATVDGGELRLDIDDFDVFTTQATERTPLVIPAWPIYFGGLPESFNLVNGAAAVDTPFVGCLGDATINGKVIDFASTVEKAGVTLGRCPSTDTVIMPKLPLPIPTVPSVQENEIIPEEPTTTVSPTTTVFTTTTEQLVDAPDTGVSETDQEEEIKELEYSDVDEEEPPTTTTTTTTTTTEPTTIAPVPEGQCRLPLRPAGDRDINEFSGTRFGNSKGSRLEFSALPGKYKSRSEFSVQFQTSAEDGVLFYMSDTKHIDFIALYMKDGKLRYGFNCGSGPAILESNESFVDGKWHTATFFRDQQNGTLQVDGNVVAQGSSQGTTRSISVDPPYFLGGLSDDALELAKGNLRGLEAGFVGCLRDLRMNNRPITDFAQQESVQPCSTKVETGAFFSVDGGYVKIQDNFRVGFDIDVSMEIKPRSTSGYLFSVHGRRDFLLLQMVNGSITLSVDNGKGIIKTTFVPPHDHYLCDGKWHTVQATKTKNVVTLGVDDVFGDPGIGPPGASATDTNSPLYVGGHPNPGKAKGMLTTEQYVGCIRRLVMDKNENKLGNAEVFGSVTTTTCPTI